MKDIFTPGWGYASSFTREGIISVISIHRGVLWCPIAECCDTDEWKLVQRQ